MALHKKNNFNRIINVQKDDYPLINILMQNYLNIKIVMQYMILYKYIYVLCVHMYIVYILDNKSIQFLTLPKIAMSNTIQTKNAPMLKHNESDQQKNIK